MYCGYGAHGFGQNVMLHLHGLQYGEAVAGFDGVASLDKKFQQCAMHWGRDTTTATGSFGLPRPGNAPDGRPRRRYTQGRVIGGGSSVNGMASNPA